MCITKKKRGDFIEGKKKKVLKKKKLGLEKIKWTPLEFPNNAKMLTFF